jgi:PHD/YefM family antitoxin component YafN of YafNO toxin-antitoxin module
MIKASEFKAKCLALMDEVERIGKRLVITRNGKANR